MARFTHKVSGVRVIVTDGKVLGSDWEPEGEKPVHAPRGKKKSAGKSDD